MKSVILFFMLCLFVSNASAAKFAPQGWTEHEIWAKYVPTPDGVGQTDLGSVSAIVDDQSGVLFGYTFYRATRSVYVMVNDGQPYVEVWDDPNICPPVGCPDSNLARVTFIPYKEKNFLGTMSVVQDDAKKTLSIEVNGEKLLVINTDTIQIVGGIITENPNVPPQQLVDPAVQCASGTSCIRALAFGKLAHETLTSHSFSFIHWADGITTRAPNAALYKNLGPDSLANSFIYADEAALKSAFHH